MKNRPRAVQQYAMRKRLKRKPSPLPGGLSSKKRQKLKSIRPTPKIEKRGSVSEGLIYLETQRLVQRNKTRRYVGIERVLDSLHMNNRLKRQAVHAACETAAYEIREIADQINDFTSRYEVQCLKRDLLSKPKLFDPSMVPKLMRAYGVRKGDSVDRLDLQIHFLSKMIQTNKRELQSVYENPPATFISIFGKDSAPELWKLFREIIYPNPRRN